jgi:hypothetical protein
MIEIVGAPSSIGDPDVLLEAVRRAGIGMIDDFATTWRNAAHDAQHETGAAAANRGSFDFGPSSVPP